MDHLGPEFDRKRMPTGHYHLAMHVRGRTGMICERCRATPWEDRRFQRGVSTPRLRGADRLSSLLCHVCGALLPEQDPTDLMLHKLAQLARFGLSSEDTPLLEPGHERA